MRRVLIVVTGALFFAGCASTSQSLKEVSKRVEYQTGHPFELSKKNNMKTAPDLPATDEKLTADRAVQIAFKSNPALKAKLEELGVSSAEITQASLPRNPSVEASVRYPEHGEGEITEVSVEQNFLSLLLFPMQGRIAGARFRQLEYRLSQEVADFSFEVKKTYYEVQAAEQKLKHREAVYETTEAAAEFARRQREAGNVNELFLQNQIAESLDSKLALAKAKAEVLTERQHLSELLGFPERRSDWKLSGELPYIQASDPALEELKKTALKERVDLLAARNEVGIQKQSVAVSRLGILDDVDVGYQFEKELDGERSDGPQVRAGLPIFDLGQNAARGSRARLKQSEYELEALENQIVSEVTLAHDRLSAARNTAREYSGSIIPARSKVVEEMQKHQNFMLVGLYNLLEAKRAEINAREEYIETLKEYWISRSEIERATGQKLTTGEILKQEVTTQDKNNKHAHHHGGKS